MNVIIAIFLTIGLIGAFVIYIAARGGREKMITREQVLREAIAQEEHNISCYSIDYGTKPKPGYEKEWKEAREKHSVLTGMLADEVAL